MIRSCLCRSVYICTTVKGSSKRVTVLTCNNSRMFCSGNDPSDDLPQYIPERIKKRLQQKGLSTKDLEYRPDGRDKSKFVEESLQEQIVDKYVDIDFPSDVGLKLPPEKDLDFPSDEERLRYFRNQERHSYRPANIDPAETSIWLFPGQGSQFVGMGKKLLQYPGVTDMYNSASEILGFDLLKICLSGPKELLDRTKFCQPAVLVTSLAAILKLREEYPKAMEHCVGVAGFSVGEFAACVHSEMISFEDAVQLVKLRANAMQTASETVAGGMLTVFCDHKSALRTAMVAAREYCQEKCGIEEPVCKIANFLCTDVKVVAGHEEALDFLQKYGEEWGLVRTKRLPVSGAFHTELMYAGKKHWKYWNYLQEITINVPKYPVHANHNGKPYLVAEGNTNKIRELLKKQIVRQVAWEQIMHIIYTRQQGVNFPQTFEVGPGRQLGYLLQRTNLRAFGSYKNIEC